MPLHIGKIIQTEVENKRLTNKEFGALINKPEKSVPEIYACATMSIDLLITISKALNKDFIAILYGEEPMKSLRNDEISKLTLQIQKITEEKELLEKELALIQNLTEAQEESISYVKKQLAQYKLLTELANKLADKPYEGPESNTSSL
jgi:hypothetical protein